MTMIESNMLEHSDDYGRLLFEIEGDSLRSGLRKYKSHIHLWEEAIRIQMWGDDDTYTLDDIIDVFIKEPVVEDVDSHSTLIVFYEDGEVDTYDLEDEVFPGLSEKMGRVLDRQWAFLEEKKDYTDTIKWFIACNSILQIVSECNPYIYGGNYKESVDRDGQREILHDSWGFNNKNDFLNMLPSLFDGRSVNDEDEELDELWAWDLQRLIMLSSYGYLCDWLSWEESLDWCLKAALRLQSIFTSWDDFISNYLAGFCFWAGEELSDENSEAHERMQVYNHYKKLRTNPWQIDWNYPLKKEW